MYERNNLFTKYLSVIRTSLIINNNAREIKLMNDYHLFLISILSILISTSL